MSILFSIFCCKKWRWIKKNSEIYKRNQQFEKGCKLLDKELDLCQLVKSIRNTNILISILLDQKQKTLCKYQHSNIIDMDENRKDDIEEDVNSNKSIDKIQTDIDILLTGGGIDYTNLILLNKIKTQLLNSLHDAFYLSIKIKFLTSNLMCKLKTSCKLFYYTSDNL